MNPRTELGPRLRERVRGPAPADRSQLARLARQWSPFAGGDVVSEVVDGALAWMSGLGPLEPLLRDPLITDVMVNGPGAVWIERDGQLRATDLVLEGPDIALLIERIVAPLGLRADPASPLVDARLPDGSRVNAIIPPLAVDGPYLTIRRFRTQAVPLRAFCTDAAVAELLSWSVRARCNIVVSGATGAGKTTLLNALAGLIVGERVVTVEDAAELRLASDHVVRLEARPANADGVGAVPIRALVRNALRMRPDRIVVGEVRGAESLDMLQALNTGHDGSLSTCHANSAADALRRIETMTLEAESCPPLAAVREQIGAAIDLVVHVARAAGGRRQVTEMLEVIAPSSPGESLGGRLLVEGGHLRARPERARRPVPS